MDGRRESQSANGSNFPLSKKLRLRNSQSPDPAITTVFLDIFSSLIRSSLRDIDSLIVIIFHVYTLQFHVDNLHSLVSCLI